MALGSLTPIDPSNFLIENDKLILFYLDDKMNTKNMWNENPADSKVKADKNWETDSYAPVK